MRPDNLFMLIWAVWSLSWIAASRWASQPVAHPATRPVIAYRIVVTLGALLIASGVVSILRQPRLWAPGPGAVWALAAAAAAGLLFTWWARLHLGRLWSASVTRKDGHRIVDSGPYGLVRHPIYTGLLAAGLASAIAAATPWSLAGFALFAAGFWMKARLEERFLTAELGRDAYDAYRQRVPMLVPGWFAG